MLINAAAHRQASSGMRHTEAGQGLWTPSATPGTTSSATPGTTPSATPGMSTSSALSSFVARNLELSRARRAAIFNHVCSNGEAAAAAAAPQAAAVAAASVDGRPYVSLVAAAGPTLASRMRASESGESAQAQIVAMTRALAEAESRAAGAEARASKLQMDADSARPPHAAMAARITQLVTDVASKVDRIMQLEAEVLAERAAARQAADRADWAEMQAREVSKQVQTARAAAAAAQVAANAAQEAAAASSQSHDGAISEPEDLQIARAAADAALEAADAAHEAASASQTKPVVTWCASEVSDSALSSTARELPSSPQLPPPPGVLKTQGSRLKLLIEKNFDSPSRAASLKALTDELGDSYSKNDITRCVDSISR